MRPVKFGKPKHLKKNKYRFHWYKAMKTMLKNEGKAPTEEAIALS